MLRFSSFANWYQNRPLLSKIAVPTSVILLLGIAALIAYVAHSSHANTVRVATNNATGTIEQYRTLRAYYTRHVVAKATKAGNLKAATDHRNRADAIPLPATMIHELSEELSTSESGVKLRLYSQHPFPARSHRQLDEFAKDAMIAFETKPDEPFIRVERRTEGEVVRVAVADRLSAQACVQCHNSHPDSPKTGWKLGDVRGVLEVEVSIADAVARTATTNWIIGIAAGGAGVAILLLIALTTWRVTQRLNQTIRVLDAVAQRDLSHQVSLIGCDEAGRIAVALDIAIENLRAAAISDADFRGQIQAIHKSQAVITFDMDGSVRSANARFLTALDYSLADIHGRHHRTFHAADSGREIVELWKGLERGEGQTGEHRWLGRDGKEVWLQASYNPIVDQHGRLVKVVVYATDVTATVKLRIEAARSHSMMENAPINMMFADRDFTIRYVNPAALQQLRKLQHQLTVSAEKLQGQSIEVFYKHPGGTRRILENPNNLPHRAQFQLGGETIDLLATAIFDRERNYIGPMVTWEVVTQQLALKKQLEDNAELLRAKADEDSRQAEELRQKVGRILVAVDAVAEGDFTQSLPSLGDDAVGQVAQALNRAIASVRQTLLDVHRVAGELTQASGQLSEVSQEIAAGAQQQASSLEETSSAMEEITITVKQNAENAQQARQLAEGSRDGADKGGQVVTKAVEAMGAINQSSRTIANIITTIDEIAFQTNLLALNAAVEAARAGEQGRGFAVVATEVGNLAQRSARAAKEIKTLIQDSVQKVGNGTDLVNRSGQSLGEIVTSVKQVTDIVGEIAAASREQSMGIDQVAKAVQQMDVVTQRNASQTEQMSATAQALSGQAEELQRLVAGFQLVEPTRNRSEARPRPARTPLRSAGQGAPRARGQKASELDRTGSRIGNGFVHN